jgi:hypothetical protein
MMRLRLYQTPIGIVLAQSLRDCRDILVLAGAAEGAEIKPVKRVRGVIFDVVGAVEAAAADDSNADDRFKWMGPDERRRERIKALNLPPSYGPLFDGDGGRNDESERRSEGPAGSGSDTDRIGRPDRACGGGDGGDVEASD